MTFGRAHPFVIRRRGLLVLGAHVAPDDAAAFKAGIGLDLHARLQRTSRRLRRHVGAIAMTVKFPAMINAAQTTLFVAPKEHRRAPVRAEGVDKGHMPLAVAEGYKILAQQTHPHGRAVGLG